MELYLYRLMRNLDPKRYAPMLLVPGYTDQFRTSPQRVIKDVQDLNIPVIRPSDPGNVGGYDLFKEILGTIRILRSSMADIIHIHTCRPQGARKITLAARLAGVPGVVRTEHFPPSVTMKPKTRYFVKPFDWLTDYIVTGSEGDRQEQIQLLGRPAEKVFRSYNSIELDHLKPERDTKFAKQRLKLDPELPIISSVGRLVHQKGHRYLIEAAAQVINQYGLVNLLLVGDGDLRLQLEELSKNLKIDSFVHFVGFQDDILPYLQATDIAVMPSLFEVFSLAMLEYMALGKPVIASDHSSFQEAIKDRENGLLVPMRNSQALAKAIIKLLKDENLRLKIGLSAMKRVRDNFGIEHLVNDMMDLYDRILFD